MSATTVVAIDWIACDGRGLCAELLPERIGSDPWGYPVADDTPLSADLLPVARRAVAACPTLALRLRRVPGR
jgi:ferredoxin